MFPIMGATNPTGYNLTRSLRFRSSASAYLNRTYVASPTDYRKYTFSAWVKLGALGVSRRLIDAGSGSDTGLLNINSDGTLEFTIVVSGSGTTYLKTNNVLRDPSAWYHIVFSCDTSVGSSQFKFYVNNVQASYSTNTAITINYGTYLNSGSSVAQLGRSATYAQYFDGYMTEVNFIDGQALTPSSFGSTNTLTGVWQPARYTGTYGTNGFYLPFTDNSALTTSSNVGLGKDFSGNGNYWTTNNISITAGTTYDSMTDVPTLTSATAANFAVLNPLDKYSSITVSGGNLDAICADVAWRSGAMTFGNFTTGKWYYEVTATNIGGSTYISAGWELSSFNHTAQTGGVGAATGNNFGVLISTGLRQTKVNSSIFSSDSNANANGDVLMIAVDFDAGKGWVGKNGTWYDSGNPSAGTNPCTTTVSGGMTPAYQMYNNGGLSANFGQRPFAYTPPTGYVALNTYNLPTSTIVKGNTVMDATLWTGNNTSRSIANAAPFKPDLVWIKSRSNAEWNILFDSVRGTGKSIYSNATNAEVTNAGSGYVSAFNSDGFSVVGGSTDSANVNATGYTYVGWQWQAGQGTTSTNTNGSITSTVSVNASAGFSVVTYTGTGSVATVGHGLGVAPNLIIIKRRDASAQWDVYHSSIGATGRLYLDATDATNTSSAPWNNTAPTSSVFTVGTATDTNASGSAIVAYCWTPIAGFSAFGSFSGNGSTDGTFIYTGFLPRFVMIKRTSSADDWRILDTARNTYNVMNLELYPNAASAETTVTDFDVVSNGIKLRNLFSGTYIYAAFATTPFKNSLAR